MWRFQAWQRATLMGPGWGGWDVGRRGGVVGGGWMDEPCLMDDQVIRQQHSLDSPTHTQTYILPQACPPPIYSPSPPPSHNPPCSATHAAPQQHSNDTSESKATGENVREETCPSLNDMLVINWKRPN